MTNEAESNLTENSENNGSKPSSKTKITDYFRKENNPKQVNPSPERSQTLDAAPLISNVENENNSEKKKRGRPPKNLTPQENAQNQQEPSNGKSVSELQNFTEILF